MSEELGKIEKLPVDSFKKGRKLFFVPLVYLSKELPLEYMEIFHRYWDQVDKQLTELSSKLGAINRIYHELVAATGKEGIETIKELNESSYNIIQAYLEKQVQFDGAEDYDTLTEFMDWNRCLLIGLQNPKVINKIYDNYVEATKKRNEAIAKKIDESLKSEEIGIIFMREGHQVQFPRDIQVFYVAPPALDEIKRWVRAHQEEAGQDLQKDSDNKDEEEPKGDK